MHPREKEDDVATKTLERIELKNLKELDGKKVKADLEKAYKAQLITAPIFSLAEDFPTQVPHPALDGQRIKPKGDPAIYFVWDNGLACHIPNPVTYELLFSTWEGILEIDPDQFAKFAKGPALSPGASILRGKGQDAVWFVSNGSKHHVASPPVMDYCAFDWDHEVVPAILLEFVPTGFTITYGD